MANFFKQVVLGVATSLGEWRLPTKLPKIGKLIKLLVIAKALSTLELESLWSSK
jgi:hypothetical protein